MYFGNLSRAVKMYFMASLKESPKEMLGKAFSDDNYTVKFLVDSVFLQICKISSHSILKLSNIFEDPAQCACTMDEYITAWLQQIAIPHY